MSKLEESVKHAVRRRNELVELSRAGKATERDVAEQARIEEWLRCTDPGALYHDET
jgi:hypothetical protein